MSGRGGRGRDDGVEDSHSTSAPLLASSDIHGGQTSLELRAPDASDSDNDSGEVLAATPLVEVLTDRRGTGMTLAQRISNTFREGSVRGSVFNLCSATLGAGALSLPYAMKQSGVLVGLMLLIVGAGATIFSIDLLIDCRSETKLKTYEALTEYTFGAVWRRIVDANIVVFCFGTAIAYVVAVGDILDPVISLWDGRPSWVRRETAMVAFWLVIMLPLSLLEKVSQLRFSSFFGVAAILYLVIAAGIHSFQSMHQYGWDDTWGSVKLANPDIVDVLQAAPVVMFAFTCQVNVYQIYDELEHASPPRMSKVTNGAIFICVLVYSLMGVFGYTDFGDATKGNILKNYCLSKHHEVVIAAAFVAITITICMAYPLVVFPCRLSVESLFFHGKPTSKRRTAFLNVTVAVLSVITALIVPSISIVFQLMGGTTSAFVCFVLPAAFAIKMGGPVYYGAKGSRSGLRRFLIWSLAIGGAVVGTLSTAATIYGLAEPGKDIDACPGS